MENMLKSSYENKEIDLSTLNRALESYKYVRGYISFDPRIMGGPDNQVLMVWDKNEHHLEIEIFPNTDKVEFFYKNKNTNEYFGEDFNFNTNVPKKMMDTFVFFE